MASLCVGKKIAAVTKPKKIVSWAPENVFITTYIIESIPYQIQDADDVSVTQPSSPSSPSSNADEDDFQESAFRGIRNVEKLNDHVVVDSFVHPRARDRKESRPPSRGKLMTPAMSWSTPLVMDIPNPQNPPSTSEEAKKEFERECTVLPAIYPKEQVIPHDPSPPPDEPNYSTKNVKIIPLEAESSKDDEQPATAPATSSALSISVSTQELNSCIPAANVSQSPSAVTTCSSSSASSSIPLTVSACEPSSTISTTASIVPTQQFINVSSSCVSPPAPSPPLQSAYQQRFDSLSFQMPPTDFRIDEQRNQYQLIFSRPEEDFRSLETGRRIPDEQIERAREEEQKRALQLEQTTNKRMKLAMNEQLSSSFPSYRRSVQEVGQLKSSLDDDNKKWDVRENNIDNEFEGKRKRRKKRKEEMNERNNTGEEREQRTAITRKKCRYWKKMGGCRRANCPFVHV
eukprot:TRINITY_DN1413_c0_g1_i1.p1 TRINITY_DN1413_c0_g1~~TRINITY_DN1413_c0_g1_i1.p1  ORF type:complete len:459 (+),score=59.24 TRINITY_DN1413_c0_g1_i1:240-1616(+)